MPVEPFSLPFEEAIRFFRDKVNVPTEAWTDLWQEEHDWGFMVAGATKRDLLLDLRGAVDRAIAEGGTLAAFRKDFDAIVAKHGWDYRGGRNWRTRTIWQTNVRGAYMAGRERQIEAGDFPYAQYVHSHAVKEPRIEHLGWDGLVLRIDDPWWKTHTPPNGWGCMCSKRGITPLALKKMGKEGPDTAPPTKTYEWVDKRSGEIREVPEGVDPGFGYTPGTIRGRQVEMFLRKLPELPAGVAVEAAAEILALKSTIPALTEAYTEWAGGVLSSPKGPGSSMAVGALSPGVRSSLVEIGVDPSTVEITLRDRELLHMGRAAKSSSVSVEDLMRIPEILASPRAVLWDTQDPALLYVFDPASGKGAGKVVVRVDFITKISGERAATNSVRTMGIVEAGNLRAKRYRLLEGKL